MLLDIKFTSVTYALKARDLLKRKNINTVIRKNPSPKKGEGCGYILTVSNPSFDIKGYLEKNNVLVKEAVFR